MIHKVPIDGKWKTVSDEQLAKCSDEIREFVLQREFDAKMNPLAHYLAHGRKWSSKSRSFCGGRFVVPPSEYPKEWLNDGVAFLNDYESDIALLLGPNQQGKSAIGVAWTGLRVLPMDKDAPIFTETPVIWHEWAGPKRWVVASYSWDNVTTVWERYQEFFPRSELGPYSPNWGTFPGETGRQKTLTFGDGRTKKCPLTCGSELYFRCYTQQQMHWEGFTTDGGQFDEQVPHEKFVGWQRGTTTRGDYTPACMTLTGHCLDDRPDTGAGGWIKGELWDTVQSMGSSADMV